MSEEFKCCPFCGGNGRLYRRSAEYENAECDDFPDELDYPGCNYFVECDGCDSASSVALTKREAVSAWNRRAEPREGDAGTNMNISLRILKFFVGYRKSPNVFGCKFCVYSVPNTSFGWWCTKHCFITTTDYKCRKFVLWSKAIELYKECEP